SGEAPDERVTVCCRVIQTRAVADKSVVMSARVLKARGLAEKSVIYCRCVSRTGVRTKKRIKTAGCVSGAGTEAGKNVSRTGVRRICPRILSREKIIRSGNTEYPIAAYIELGCTIYGVCG